MNISSPKNLETTNLLLTINCKWLYVLSKLKIIYFITVVFIALLLSYSYNKLIYKKTYRIKNVEQYKNIKIIKKLLNVNSKSKQKIALERLLS